MSQTATSQDISAPRVPRAVSDGHAWACLFAAWMVALAATFGALFIGEVMGQTPCNLCWHQRVFMFPLAVILAVATFREDLAIWRYALPIAALGWLVAAFHSLLYSGVIPEAIKPCGQGPSCSSAAMTILGLPLPYISLAAFTAVAVLLLPASRKVSNV